MNTNFKVTGLTRLEIKAKSIAPEADALTNWPSELLKISAFQQEVTRNPKVLRNMQWGSVSFKGSVGVLQWPIVFR